MKPIVHIKDAMIFNNRLMGVVIDYPEEHQGYPGAVTNGKDVITSSIVSIEGDTVETQRTIYHVDSWVKSMGV
jgi:hypothetical protein